MTILLFDGEEDAYWWILCLEKFFKEHETPKSLKVLKAVGALRGSAFTWWIWWCRVHPRYNWDTFTTALLWRFKPEWREILPNSDEEEEPIEESSSLIEQTVTVDVNFSKFVEDFDKSENEDFHNVADFMIPLEPPDPNPGTIVEALEESFDPYRSQQEQSTKFDSAESENLQIPEPILYITLTPLALAANKSLNSDNHADESLNSDNHGQYFVFRNKISLYTPQVESVHSTTQDVFSLDVVGEAEDKDTLLGPMTSVLGKLIQPQLSPFPEPPDSISVPVSLLPLEPTHHLFDEMPERDAARFFAVTVLHTISMTYSPGPFNDNKFHGEVDFEIPPKPPNQMVIQTPSLFLSYFSKQFVHHYPKKAEKEHSTSLRPRFNALNGLVNVILEVTKCVIEFSEIQVQYNSHKVTASTQAINLIGSQGSLIKTIQESTGASVRVLAREDLPSDVGADERIVELQGETLKVLKGIEAVVGHLRKFLVDHSVIPLFEKIFNASISQDCQTDFWAEKPSLHSASQCNIVTDIPPSTKRDYFFADRERQLDSLLSSSTMSQYEQDSSISGLRPATFNRASASFVTTVIQTMQIPLSYAEDIIGVQGANIDFILRTSGAILTVQESRVPDEIIVEITGTSFGYFFVASIVIVDVKIYGQWFTKGNMYLSMVANPTSQMSVVGYLVAAQAAAVMGWKESGICFFSLGIANYLVFFVTLYQRFPGNNKIPTILRPVFFLFFVAPSTASLALHTVCGCFDTASKMLFLLSLFLFLSMVSKPLLFKKSMKKSNVAWWAYSFPLTAMAHVIMLVLSLISGLVCLTLSWNILLLHLVWTWPLEPCGLSLSGKVRLLSIQYYKMRGIFLGHIIKSTYMKQLTLPFALEGEYGFQAANLYAKCFW